MIERVISGGQTGADQAGWRAAKRFGIPTGGWMPKNFRTEDGLHSEFAKLYGAKEHSSPAYVGRTIANIQQADTTILFGSTVTPGSRLVIRHATNTKHPVLCIRSRQSTSEVYALAEEIRLEIRHVRSLNVAGNRESSAPGIGKWAEDYLCELFYLIGHRELK